MLFVWVDPSISRRAAVVLSCPSPQRRHLCPTVSKLLSEFTFISLGHALHHSCMVLALLLYRLVVGLTLLLNLSVEGLAQLSHLLFVGLKVSSTLLILDRLKHELAKILLFGHGFSRGLHGKQCTPSLLLTRLTSFVHQRVEVLNRLRAELHLAWLSPRQWIVWSLLTAEYGSTR